MSNTGQEVEEMAVRLIQGAEIKIFLKKDKEKTGKNPLLATAKIILGGIIEINGFSVRESDYEGKFWIQPPTYGPRYTKALFIENEVLYGDLIEKIDRYYKNKVELSSLEDVVEDMPF